MTDKLQHKVDLLLMTVGTFTGIAGTMASVEQVFRIIFLFVSIVSCLLIIMVNWKKGIKQIKEFFKK